MRTAISTWALRIAWVVLLLFVSVLPAAAALELSEILSGPGTDWDGDGAVDSKLDEWVEVYNSGAAPEDLTDLFLRDGTGDTYHFGFSGSLAPGEVILVTGADAVAWQADNGASTVGLSLNNSGDLVELVRDSGTPQVVDAVTVPSHAAVSDRSFARLPQGAEWLLYDGLSPYSGSLEPQGTGCNPSPGAANTCQSTVATRSSSIGRVKARFDR